MTTGDKQDLKNEKGLAPSDQKRFADAPPPYDPSGGSQAADAGFWPDEKKSQSGGYYPPSSPPPGPPGPPGDPRGPPGGPPYIPGPSFQPPHPAAVARTNYVNVENPNNNIRGVWYIDPSLEIHPSLLGPIGEGLSQRQNVRLYSKNGSVNAEIQLLGEGRERALMDVGSKNGSVTVKIAQRTAHTLFLNIYSHNGGLTVYLPDDFTGAIKHWTHNGKVTFSPALKQRHTVFSDLNGQGRCFIGDWASTGYGGDGGREWHGDEIVANSKNGNIKFYLASEAQGGSASGSGSGSSGGGFGGFLKKFK